MMKSIIKSKNGISPILATLLLIVIAVAAVFITYAWVMTFTGSTSIQSEAILVHENVRFYNDTGTLKVEIVLRNSGKADAKVAQVYFGYSDSNLQQVSSVTYDPTTQIIVEGSSLKITFNLSWTSGTRYYFKVVTVEGLNFSFNEEA
jgi:flagellin-like protein